MFFACFKLYVRQPGNHIGWATSMPFTSIYPTDQSLKYSWKNIENWWFWKTQFIESAILIFFKHFFFLHPHENQSQIMCYNEWDSIFMIMMTYSQKWPTPNINTGSVCWVGNFMNEWMVVRTLLLFTTISLWGIRQKLGDFLALHIFENWHFVNMYWMW